MKMKIVAAIAAALATAGCIQTVTPVQAPPVSTVERVRERNYALGESRTVVVGEALVRVRESGVRTTLGTAFQAGSEARYRAGFGSGVVTQGMILPVEGTREADGRRYRIARMGEVAFQVADDGSIVNHLLQRNAYNGEWVVVAPELTFDPAPPVLTEVVRTAPIRNLDDLGYEIVLKGVDEQSLRFEYRELALDNTVRPASIQALVHPVREDRLRFRDLVIRIVRIGPNDLEYVVEAD